MISERILTSIVKTATKKQLALNPTDDSMMPPATPGMKYMLYMHVPFCERLCPYCSFNRYPFKEEVAKPYFESMRREMLMLEQLGYDFESIYVGGGTPTIMIDELCKTLDLAREHFSIREVSSETNPNHLTEPYLEKLQGRVQRLSVGVQSFDDDLLRQMDRFEKYGSGEEIFERIGVAAPYFDDLNVDMIFNFPSQTEKTLRRDIAMIEECGCDQVTFSPLYVSDATTRKMTSALGDMDYNREYRYYNLIDAALTEGADSRFERRTLWTFNRKAHVEKHASACSHDATVDEYAVSYEQYPAIGSGAISHLNGCLYVNSFSIREYNDRIASGRMSIMGKTPLSAHDLMRYRFLLQLYDLRLDKKAFERDFGCSVEKGLTAEMAFMRMNGAFATDNDNELTLTPKGRYLTLVMYRQFLSGMNNLRDQARAALKGPERQLLFGDGRPE